MSNVRARNNAMCTEAPLQAARGRQGLPSEGLSLACKSRIGSNAEEHSGTRKCCQAQAFASHAAHRTGVQHEEEENLASVQRRRVLEQRQ